MTAPDTAVRVLLVDDSAVVRGALTRIIDAEPDLKVVCTAHNGRVALDVLRRVAVDIVLLDIEMPEMDGLTALPRILAEHPKVRVVMASSLTQQGAAITMQALALGAVDYISKPSARAGSADLAGISADIVAKLRAIGRAGRLTANLLGLPGLTRPAPAARLRSPRAATILGGALSDAAPRVVAIASSTGGPNALVSVLTRLPRDFPLPILITQHMPPLFTVLLAQRLAREAGRECVEGREGDPIRSGCTYVAPGDYHMLVGTHEGRPYIRLSQAPPENFCRPAADVMLRSVVSTYGSSALIVVLTGMGEDGRRGCEAARAAGGSVMVQDEASSVVWGMPGAVCNAGLANWVVPLADIADKIAAVALAPAT